MSKFSRTVKTLTIFSLLLVSSNQNASGKTAADLYGLKNLSSKFVSWAINPKIKTKGHINLASAWKKFKKRKEVVVAIVDTGIDPNHPFLKRNLFVPKKTVKNSYGYDFSKSAKSFYQPIDEHSHGTHVSGIVKSVFPEVKLLTLKYYNPKASGQENLDSTIKALEYAVKSNVDIINYSGGGPEPSIEELRILKQAEAKGILVVAAAGNEKANIDNKKNAYYPASYGLSNIITVTAHDQNLRVLASSNWGLKSVDLSAPGYKINSASAKGRRALMTGTSQATAFVTGVAALIKSKHPEFTFAQIKMIIRNSTVRETTLLGKSNTGGKLDAAEALKLADSFAKSRSQRSLANKKASGL